LLATAVDDRVAGGPRAGLEISYCLQAAAVDRGVDCCARAGEHAADRDTAGNRLLAAIVDRRVDSRAASYEKPTEPISAAAVDGRLEEGASGSSAGPGAATAAGLVGFSIGSETGGSIVSPSMRCGITGLRPTYGRVPRTGAMTLCWSLDKLGPMTRTVEDALLVLQAISGPDAGDVSSIPSHLDFDASASVKGLRVGYFPAWMKENPATDVDRAALETIKKLGMVPVEVELPNWPYNSLNLILFAEGAAAFEELTLTHGIDQLKVQTPDAWPNLFRQSRFLSAVDFVQADRFRRKVAQEMARIFSQVDLLLVPSLRDEMLTISNQTGHPSLTLRAGFVQVAESRSDWAPDPKNPLPKFSPPRRVPHGITLIGRLFEEGTLGRAGIALERAFAVSTERPPSF
jgi:Asp-tRNA(Asn)/Glu-tRNA(Gln) amidotransferase A subunit family amidase